MAGPSTSSRGFSEEEHTADWELRVWAEDLPALFAEAARGMYYLSGTRLAEVPHQSRHLELSAGDEESLLVSFLNELLFLGEEDGLGFDDFALEFRAGSLVGDMGGRPIVSQSKEVKAVTFHNLEIRATDRGLTCNLVFDV